MRLDFRECDRCKVTYNFAIKSKGLPTFIITRKENVDIYCPEDWCNDCEKSFNEWRKFQ